ncbi:MAG: hypothetical protein D6741_16610, partial [Planctomycetota bacterium]
MEFVDCRVGDDGFVSYGSDREREEALACSAGNSETPAEPVATREGASTCDQFDAEAPTFALAALFGRDN